MKTRSAYKTHAEFYNAINEELTTSNDKVVEIALVIAGIAVVAAVIVSKLYF